MNKVNWGIIAPGNIAGKFATALQGVERANLYCVASRNPQRAQTFAEQYGFDKIAMSYQKLIDDPAVDVIYIASPHHLHMQQSIDCLTAGKAVLCEKPMTVNSEQAKQVIAVADQHEQFYMEAVWTRFMPIYKQIRAWLDEGLIGQVQMVQASFGFSFATTKAADSRLMNPKLAGGALLDMGIYPITFAQWVLQQSPSEITATGSFTTTGVDEKVAMLLTYPDDTIAVLASTLAADTSYDAWICGSEGRIKVPMFWCAESATLMRNSDQPNKHTTVRAPHTMNGYEYEVEEVHRCLDAGLKESPLMPWQSSLDVMQIMDHVRAQIGLKYPFER